MNEAPRWPAWLVGAMASVAAIKYLLGIPEPGWDSALEKAFPVLAMAALAAASRPGRVGWFVVAGLLASALGDILLDLGASTFLPGVAAFALAHVFYIAAFTLADRRLRLLVAIPFILWGGLVLWRLMPDIGSEAVPVAAYVAIISVMMWRAAAQAAGRPFRLAWLGLVGAVLFGASDTLIALGRWGGLVTDGWLVMLLYWAGQAGIAGWGREAEMRRPGHASPCLRVRAFPKVVESPCERAGRPPEREESPGSGGQGAR